MAAMVHSVWTLLMFLLFVGIVAWAWSSKRRRDFDEAARLPLEDDQTSAETGQGGNNIG